MCPRRTTDGLVCRLVDDAAVFPPGDAPLPVAVERHRTHRGAWYARFVGPLLTRAAEAPRLARLLAPGEELPVVVVSRPGTDPALVPAAVETLRADARAHVRGVELPLSDAGRLGVVLGQGVPVWLEVPGQDDGRALDDVLALRTRPPGGGGASRAEVMAKLRTGGLTAGDFPSEHEVARFVVGCVRRGLTFKLTAGLHHALRHTDSATGFEHHGVANVLAATWASTDGADVDEVARLLAERDARPLVDLLCGLDADAVARTRARFASFGCCEVTDPLTHLTDLHVLTGPPARTVAAHPADPGHPQEPA